MVSDGYLVGSREVDGDLRPVAGSGVSFLKITCARVVLMQAVIIELAAPAIEVQPSCSRTGTAWNGWGSGAPPCPAEITAGA